MKADRPWRRRSRAPPAAEARGGETERTLKSGHLSIERKEFFFALRENARGRFLRITEESRGQRERIIIPAPGLAAFQQVVEEMARSADRPGTEEGGAKVDG